VLEASIDAYDITFDGTDTWYVTEGDTLSDVIREYDTSWTLQNTTNPSTPTIIYGITWEGPNFWVSCETSPNESAVELDTSYSTVSSFAYEPGVSKGRERGLAIDASGDLWVSNAADGLIEQWSQAGTLLSSFPASGGLYGISIYDGDLYVAVGNEIRQYTTSGTLVNTIDTTGIANVTGIHILADGTFYASDNDVGVYRGIV